MRKEAVASLTALGATHEAATKKVRDAAKRAKLMINQHTIPFPQLNLLVGSISGMTPDFAGEKKLL